MFKKLSIIFSTVLVLVLIGSSTSYAATSKSVNLYDNQRTTLSPYVIVTDGYTSIYASNSSKDANVTVEVLFVGGMSYKSVYKKTLGPGKSVSTSVKVPTKGSYKISLTNSKLKSFQMNKIGYGALTD